MNGRVLLDGRTLVGRSGARGIGAYVRGLVGGMASTDAAPRIDVLLSRGLEVPLESARHGLGIGPRVPSIGTRLQPLVDPLILAVSLLGTRYVAYHATEWGQPLVSRVPTVITVHDMIPFIDSQYRRSSVRYALARRLLSRAAAVITPSRCSARDVVRLADVDPSRVTVIPHGVGAEMQPIDAGARAKVAEQWGVTRGGYLLAVGVFDPRKRLSLLLDTVRLLRHHYPVDLLIAGAQGGFEPSVRAAVRSAGLERQTRLLGHVPAADLPGLYGASACLVFTSSYEGFGLPLLEAMACGAPVAAFDNSSIPEVVPEGTPLAPDGDVAHLADIAAGVIPDGPERERRIAAGLTHAAAFSWPRAARATIDVYERIGR